MSNWYNHWYDHWSLWFTSRGTTSFNPNRGRTTGCHFPWLIQKTQHTKHNSSNSGPSYFSSSQKVKYSRLYVWKTFFIYDAECVTVVDVAVVDMLLMLLLLFLLLILMLLLFLTLLLLSHTLFFLAYCCEFFLCFSLLRNTKKIFNTGVPSTAITSVNGIRVISISWVVLGHTFLRFVFSPFTGMRWKSFVVFHQI